MSKYTPHENIYEPQKETDRSKWWPRLIIDERFYLPDINVIDWFFDEYRFLTNYHDYPIMYNGKSYRTTEGAYQAAKAISEEDQENIRLAKTPAKAKKLGQIVQMRSDWEDIKEQVMRDVVWEKFNSSADLTNSLISTGNSYLVEGTVWHDNIWGICIKKDCEKCKDKQGRNLLGKILMETRKRLNERT